MDSREAGCYKLRTVTRTMSATECVGWLAQCDQIGCSAETPTVLLEPTYIADWETLQVLEVSTATGRGTLDALGTASRCVFKAGPEYMQCL